MDEWREVAHRVRNWGRWGDDDELGTLNLITPEVITRAARTVRKGATFSLAIPLDLDGPQDGMLRSNPIRLMGAINSPIGPPTPASPLRFSDDYVIMPLQAATQWDALSHVSYDDEMYNGFSASLVTTAGAAKLGIQHAARRGGLVGRGLLIDVARHFGVPYLEPGTVVQDEDLDAALNRQGVAVEPGDILLLRTGWRRRYLEAGRQQWSTNCPGLSWTCAEWLHASEVAAVAADNVAVEAGGRHEGNADLVLHMLTLRDMGLQLGEVWDFEALADDCAADGVYECLLVAAPLAVTGGVGSPVNPIAIK